MAIITHDKSVAKVSTTPVTNNTSGNRSKPSAFLSPNKQLVLKWLTIAVAVYALITAVKLISSGFSLAAGEDIHQLFALVDNVLIAFSVGILATVLTQSSTTTTSITVGLAAAGLPLSAVIPILLGANIGTTVTNTIVALSAPQNGNDGVFKRSFAAASLHDFFNIAAIAIFLPLEILFNILERTSEWVTGLFISNNTTEGVGSDSIFGEFSLISDALGFASEVLYSVLSADIIVNTFGHIITGLLIIGIAVSLLIVSIRYISKQLGCLLVGKTEKALKFAISHNSFAGLFSGFLITSAVQSSSTTTSLAVPLVGSGSFSLKQIYPFVVGANIGTTLTALLIGFTMLGTEYGELAVQAALVHVLFNVSAAAVIMLTPVLRSFPVAAAEWAGGFVANNRLIAIVYVVIMFVVVPVILLLLGLLF